MTDYYTQWCVAVSTTPEEQTWFKEILKKAERFFDLRSDDKEDSVEAKALAEELKDVHRVLDSEDAFLHLEVRYEEDAAYFSDDGGAGDIDQTVALLQAFLRKFHPDKSIEVEWAHTASRHHSDAYGGGACFVTAAKVEWNSTLNWLSEKRREFEKK